MMEDVTPTKNEVWASIVQAEGERMGLEEERR